MHGTIIAPDSRRSLRFIKLNKDGDVRAKSGLVPDCDVHGEPMYLDERPASALGLEGDRDLIFWRCAREGCGRFFYGTVGYRYCPAVAGTGPSTPRCTREGAFLVAQQILGRYICPVAGCKTLQAWQADSKPATDATEALNEPSFSLR